MHCSACDTSNEAGARFCRVCGQQLAGAQAAARTGVTQALAQAAPRCPNCGRDNPAGARYCVYCASQLDAAPVSSGTLAQAAGFAAPMTPTSLTLADGEPLQIVLRAVWFVIVGWWLGLLWTLFAWLFILSIVGMPVGVMMLNAIPQVMTLQRTRRVRPATAFARHEEHPFVLRALWFIFIGFWASLLWMLLAWAFSASLVLLPIGFWMFDRVPTIATLAQEP